MNDALSIRELHQEDSALVADLTARGMRDNPIDIAAFGPDATLREERMRRLFRVALPMTLKKGVLLGACDGAKLVGIAASLSSAECQPRAAEKVILAPRLFLAVGFIGFVRLLRWTQAWAAHDLRETHSHLGPVAVDAHMQRKGIGGALLAEYCARLDRTHTVGYLETDKAENVKFYVKFGFQTMAEARVLMTPNWFMRRPAR
jgi:GNAT superfamily N-acetyltransferase